MPLQFTPHKRIMKTTVGRQLLLTVLVCACLAAAPIVAQDDLKARLEEYLAACVDAEQFNGSVLVAKDDAVLVSQGYGWANAELRVPNTRQTRFRLGSITKQFTAMAVMRMARSPTSYCTRAVATRKRNGWMTEKNRRD